MKPTKVNYAGIKEKMKFGSQELPILTNHYHFYGREQMNDKFNVLVDHIWNIPKSTDHNENFVVQIKRGIICALYNFCNADNQGVPLLTKASPSGKGYTYFTLLTGPHKGIFTNFADLCTAKEGINNPRFKGFYTKEEAEKSLEMDTINPETIKKALNPGPTQINIGAQEILQPNTYKDKVVIPISSIKEMNIKKFRILQKFLSKIHREEFKIPGIFIKTHAYFNSKNICCKTEELCNKIIDGNCPCKIKFLFRKAALDLEIYKPVAYEDLTITPKLLFSYGLLDSAVFPPSIKFEHFNTVENDAINYLQAVMMNHIALKINSCPSRLGEQCELSTHVIKILFEDHIEYPVLFNDGYEVWEVLGNFEYQYNLFRAQIMGNEWFFTDQDETNFNLFKETSSIKMFLPVENGKPFLPFPQESNKLVQHFQKERLNRKIYESSGCYGQGTPTQDLSLSESSENPDNGETLEEISLSR